jgi:hypothetical protein
VTVSALRRALLPSLQAAADSIERDLAVARP